MEILDNDLYKFTTSYAYMKLFPNAECTFTFIDRNKKPRSKEFISNFKKSLENLSNATISESQIKWCKTNIPYIPEWYWEWLKSFRYDVDKIKYYLDSDDVLHIDVTDKIYKCTLYEVPLLALVTETENFKKYFEYNKFKENLLLKINSANDNEIKFSEFGTRRRFSFLVQSAILSYINLHSKTCVGTSNVYFAWLYNMKPIGTHPHEWFMFHAALYGYKEANYIALENWTKVYDGDLGIALTDTFTSDVFFKDFSMKQAKLFDGIRHDSGDEIEFINKAIDFYKSKGVDYTSKTIVFSNSLDFTKAAKIKTYCDNQGIKASFGIGTNLTNDVGYPAENIVMKMSKCRINENQNWENCVKLSNDLGKVTGNKEEVELAIKQLGL